MQFTKQDTLLVKGVAIIMMIVHHCFAGPDRYAGYEINFGFVGEEVTVMISGFFKICVGIFVFLSGYGITVSLMKQETLKTADYALQIKKRICSLMSGYWFIFIVSFVLSLIIDRTMFRVYKDASMINSVFFVVADFLGLANLFGTPTFIGTWWYMSLAIIIVVITPVFFAILKKYGAFSLFIITFCLCGFYKEKNYEMVRWLFTLALGMWAAERNILAKWAQKRIISKSNRADYLLKLLLYSAALVACVFIRQRADYTVSYLRDGLIPMFVVFYCYAIVSKIPVVNKVLIFFGKHSMNIFLFHTFLRAYYLKDFIYSLKYPGLIVFVLIGLSLICSVIFEFVKDKIKYNKLIDCLFKRIAFPNSKLY